MDLVWILCVLYAYMRMRDYMEPNYEGNEVMKQFFIEYLITLVFFFVINLIILCGSMSRPVYKSLNAIRCYQIFRGFAYAVVIAGLIWL